MHNIPRLGSNSTLITCGSKETMKGFHVQSHYRVANKQHSIYDHNKSLLQFKICEARKCMNCGTAYRAKANYPKRQSGISKLG